MWYRDAALIAVRQQDLERDLARAAAATALREASRGTSDLGGVRVLRVRSAVAVRRFGEAVIGLSRRIDVPDCDGTAYATSGRPAAS